MAFLIDGIAVRADIVDHHGHFDGFGGLIRLIGLVGLRLGVGCKEGDLGLGRGAVGVHGHIDGAVIVQRVVLRQHGRIRREGMLALVIHLAEAVQRRAGLAVGIHHRDGRRLRLDHRLLIGRKEDDLGLGRRAVLKHGDVHRAVIVQRVVFRQHGRIRREGMIAGIVHVAEAMERRAGLAVGIHHGDGRGLRLRLLRFGQRHGGHIQRADGLLHAVAPDLDPRCRIAVHSGRVPRIQLIAVGGNVGYGFVRAGRKLQPQAAFKGSLRNRDPVHSAGLIHAGRGRYGKGFLTLRVIQADHRQRHQILRQHGYGHRKL